MKKMINTVHIEGKLYEQHLTFGKTQPTSKRPNEQYIRGSIFVDTSIDSEIPNVVEIRVFEMEKTSKGDLNNKFTTLSDIMNQPTVVVDGEDAAALVRVDTNLITNDFVAKTGEMVSPMQLSGGFIHIQTRANYKPTADFSVDFVISNFTDEMKKDESAGGALMPTGSLLVKGYVFDFRNEVYPCTFVVRNGEGVSYIKELCSRGPVFTKVWGSVISQTDTVTKTEASAFGGDRTVSYTTTRKAYEITGMNAEPYPFGEGTLTTEQLQAAIANRNVMLEAKKTSYSMRQTAQPQQTANTISGTPVKNNTEFVF